MRHHPPRGADANVLTPDYNYDAGLPPTNLVENNMPTKFLSRGTENDIDLPTTTVGLEL